MNNKKTDNYKNYKYVYTGYKDYCKNHNIKTKPEKKENIVHDHRLTFDFNNPNEHYHDYSFDFNNPNEHYHDYSFDLPGVKNKTTNKTNYQEKQKYTTPTTRTTTTTTYTNKGSLKQTTAKKNNNNNNSGCGCLIMIFFFFIFFVSLISSFEDIFDVTDDYNDDYSYNNTYDEYDDYDNNYEINSYEDAINDYILAIKNKDIIYLEGYFYSEYDKNQFYQEIEDFKTKYPVYYSFYSQIATKTHLNKNVISKIESSINSKYDYNVIKIDDAYDVNIYFEINNTQIYKTITVFKTNNYWYLLKN